MGVLPSGIFFMRSLSYAAALGLLSMGLTLTYVTTKVPNFAHATIAMIGATVMVWLIDNYYYTNPSWMMYLVGGLLGGLIAGLASLFMYTGMLRPLEKRGNTVIGLMIATFAFDIILLNILTIYMNAHRGVNIKQYISADVSSFQPKISILGSQIGAHVVVLPLAALLLSAAFHLFLTKTKFGVAMRATIENPGLAAVMGVNVNLVYMVSWFISGFIAGVAGSLMVFTFKNANPSVSALIIVSVFAGSIVGGLASVYWGLIGGLIVGLSEKLGTEITANLYNALFPPGPGETPLSLASYEKVISLGLVIIVLLFSPQGLAGVNWRGLAERLGLSRLVGRAKG